MPTYANWMDNPFQYSLEDYNTSTPEGDAQAVSYGPGWAPELLDLRQKVLSGQATPWEREWFQQQYDASMALPLRDPSTLQYNAGEDAPDRVSGGSPDLGNLMLTLAGKLEQGNATPQERSLFDTTLTALKDQNWRASTPQASDAFSPLGDNLMSALGVLGLGATGGLAAAPLFAGGAGLATTLGSLGSLAGVAGTGAGVLGQATDQPWLSQLGLGLGIAGGLAGGLGGLSTLWSTGVNSLSDAAKLAQSAGRITGSLGRIPGADPLKDVSRYLGYAGQAGQLGAGVGADDWLGWGGTNSPLAQNVAPQVSSNVSNLLSAADMATQRGGGDVADFSYEDFIGWGDPNAGDPWNSAMPADTPGWEDFTGWGGDETQTGWYQNADLDTSGGGGNWLQTILGGLGGAGKLLMGAGGGGAGGAGLLGPLLASLGSVGGGAIGSNAANEAARLQAQALNRGIDLQTAQWLQQQSNLAPYLQAGQGGLAQLQQLAGREQPGLPGQMASIDPRAYAMPDATPRWTPQGYQGPAQVNAGDYRWTPQAGPQAQDYRYTPGTIPQASQYRYTPGAVPTLIGKDLLANDPGVQFRMDEGRKALEASAAARGGLLSGPTLAALQRQGQELSSQEYGSAWNRASQQAQLREGWAQTASQMGWGQAEAESRLREQVNQIASQQGWNQATAEAAFREQQAQLASSQGWTQALQGQQTGFNQGLESQKWLQTQNQLASDQLYNRNWDQYKTTIGLDQARNQTDYERQQAAYKQQLAQFLLPYEQQSTLANLGGQAVGMYGQQGQGATNAISNLLTQVGNTQGQGALSGANSWMNALQNIGGAAQGYFGNQAYEQGRQSVLSGINR